MYTLAGEWGTGSHFLVVPRIDVSRHCIRLRRKHVKKRSGTFFPGWQAKGEEAVQRLLFVVVCYLSDHVKCVAQSSTSLDCWLSMLA